VVSWLTSARCAPSARVLSAFSFAVAVAMRIFPQLFGPRAAQAGG
jgi:hypothetical protein